MKVEIPNAAAFAVPLRSGGESTIATVLRQTKMKNLFQSFAALGPISLIL